MRKAALALNLPRCREHKQVRRNSFHPDPTCPRTTRSPVRSAHRRKRLIRGECRKGKDTYPKTSAIERCTWKRCRKLCMPAPIAGRQHPFQLGDLQPRRGALPRIVFQARSRNEEEMRSRIRLRNSRLGIQCVIWAQQKTATSGESDPAAGTLNRCEHTAGLSHLYIDRSVENARNQEHTPIAIQKHLLKPSQRHSSPHNPSRTVNYTPLMKATATPLSISI